MFLGVFLDLRLDEDKHKHWCDGELGKNRSLLTEKSIGLSQFVDVQSGI